MTSLKLADGIKRLSSGRNPFPLPKGLREVANLPGTVVALPWGLTAPVVKALSSISICRLFGGRLTYASTPTAFGPDITMVRAQNVEEGLPPKQSAFASTLTGRRPTAPTTRGWRDGPGAVGRTLQGCRCAAQDP